MNKKLLILGIGVLLFAGAGCVAVEEVEIADEDNPCPEGTEFKGTNFTYEDGEQIAHPICTEIGFECPECENCVSGFASKVITMEGEVCYECQFDTDCKDGFTCSDMHECVEDAEDEYYVSEKFGIKFKLNLYDYYVEQTGEDLRESENGIGFEAYGDRIKVFYKQEDQGIESAILELIEGEGKDPNNCIVHAGVPNLFNNQRFVIDLADPNIVYTDEDMERIAEADVQAELDGGPFNGTWMKKKIYNEHLIDLCTEYADPAGLATSKTLGSSFEYNDEKAKDRFIFLEESFDQEFYKDLSIEFI